MVRRPSHSGFTLVEMIVVLLIAALMATATVVSLTGTLRLASGKDLTEQLEELDRSCRRHARQANRACWLEFDLDRQQIRVLDSLEPVSVRRVWQPPGNWRLTQVATLDQTLTQGQLALIYSGHGWTQSYEVCLNTSANPQPVRWGVSGLTGYPITNPSADTWPWLQQKVAAMVEPKTTDTASGGHR